MEHPRDAIIRITACAICGSDLHLLDGYQPTMKSGDILGHEYMGEVIELGSEVSNLKIGDRVVVPFTVSCGQCWFCQNGLFSACDRTNPNAELAARPWASRRRTVRLQPHDGGLQRRTGGLPRCPWPTSADQDSDSVTGEQALSCPTFPHRLYGGGERADPAGDTVAIWGCGRSASSPFARR